MQISIANAILVARLVGRSIVRLGLKMWLRFNKSNILGCELNDQTWNANGGWSILNGVASNDGSGDTLTNSILRIGRLYKVTIKLSTYTSGTFSVFLGSGTESTTFSGLDEFTFTDICSVDTNARISSSSGIGSVAISNISIKEVAQFVPDDSNNCNECKLFTGKALSFDGSGDFIDLGDVGVSLKTICFWINLDSTSEKVLELSSTHSVEVSSGIVVLNGTWDNSVVYVNNSATTDITNTIWQRVVITTTTAITVNDFQLGRINAVRANGKFIASDLQLYNSTWTTSDVAFDYNNPNHLVTDNPNTTLTLSNLSSYYALSEGGGSVVYDSATTLGSEQIVNGDFSAGFTDWTNGSDWSIVSDTAFLNNSDDQANSTLTSDASLISDRFYKATYTISDYVSGELALVNGNVSIPSTNGTHTITFTGNTSFSVKRKGGATTLKIDNVSVKEISAGTIVGATYVFAEQIIPQLGMVDWVKSTPVLNEITLIQAPNNKGFDILGTPLRLREHSFNLDGIGYGEVADANSLDFGAGDFTVEVWVKASYLSGGSTLNSIISLGGAMTDINTVSIGVYSTTSKFAVYVASLVVYSTNAFVSGKWYHVLVTRDSGLCTMYVDSVVQATISRNNSITNGLVKHIGRDSGTNRFYSNLIGEPRIYDRYLTQKEVTQNYNVGLPSHSNDSSYSDDYSSDYGF